MVNRGQKVYVVFGPSGCGKTTMIRKIIEECPDKYCFTISRKIIRLQSLCDCDRVGLKWIAGISYKHV